MATLQIKNLPDDVRSALGERADELGISMSEVVTRMLRRELSRPSIDGWARAIESRDEDARAIDTLGAIDAVRSDPRTIAG